MTAGPGAGLARRQVRAAALATLTLGALLAIAQIGRDVAQEHDRMTRVGAGLMALVREPAARAAYTYDRALAEAVVAALDEVPAVVEARLVDHLDAVLAERATPLEPAPFRWLTDAVFGPRLELRETLTATDPMAPDPRAPIGALHVALDTRTLAADLLERSLWLALAAPAAAAALALALSALFHIMVTAPLARLSGEVARLDPDDPTAAVRVDPAHRNDELGALARAVGALLDRFRDADRRFAAAARALPDGLAVLDAAGRLTFHTAQFAADQPKAVAARLAPGVVWADALRAAAAEGPLHHAEMGADFLAADLAAYAAPERDAAVRLADGRTIRVRVRPMPDGGRVILTSDVTERRRVEEALRRAERLGAVGTLAGGVAHDFNNLLATIFAATEVAQARLPPDSPAQAPLARVIAAGRRGRSLVEQVLAFSRAERAAAPVGDLRAGVAQALALTAPALDPATRLETDLGPAPLPVAASEAQLHQIVSNLVLNAGQALPEGRGRVRVEARAEGGEASLRVSDDGPGMDAATLARVFEPFFTTKPVGRGSGLGLAVVYGVARSLGGRVEATSRPGEGACFEVRLPLAG